MIQGLFYLFSIEDKFFWAENFFKLLIQHLNEILSVICRKNSCLFYKRKRFDELPNRFL